MHEYMKSLGSVMMLTALANMLVPEGNMKKFVALATGFMLITTAISILPSEGGEFSFSADTFELKSEEIAAGEENYRLQVIKKHCENLENLIKEQMKFDSYAKVQTDENGNITQITLYAKGDESRAISYIVKELKFPRERIKIVNDKN